MQEKKPVETKIIPVLSRMDFRKWLRNNHHKEKKIGIILHKKHTGKPSPSHRELIEEAICFGWIDTTVKRLDENKYLRNFTRRNNKSKWSINTLAYAKKLTEEGKMTRHGLNFYKLGLQKPPQDHGIPKNPNMPHDLKKAFVKNKTAKNNFDGFTPSTKKMLYRWILLAKLPETMKKRIRRTVTMARDGKTIV